MSSDCSHCQNLIFKPAPDTFLGGLQAKIHSDEASLKQCFDKRECHLCAILYSMLENRKHFGPTSRQRSGELHRFSDVSLALHYKEEEHDELEDWEFLDEEVHQEDAPKAIVYSHPLGTEDIRILNPEVLSMSAWDPLDDFKSETQPSRTIPHPSSLDLSTGSDASMSLAREWIDICRDKHENCGQKSTRANFVAPTRLLDVSKAIDKYDGIVTLIDTTEYIALSTNTCAFPYATLSHRWNPSYTYFTETSNIHTHLNEGMQINVLPKTFAEACITVRKLGLQYIWIDSLCIIQDSNSDKAKEIPKMADYYQSAELNLCASTESLGGLWSDRDSAGTRPFAMTATIELAIGKRKRVTLDLAPVLRTDKSHLDYRGWILQERIFPRRTLFFDAYWLSFECGQMSASESCAEGIKLDASSNRSMVENAIRTELDRDCALSIIGGLVRSMEFSSSIPKTGVSFRGARKSKYQTPSRLNSD